MLNADARTMAKAEDRELFHAADDLALFLHDLSGGEQLLELGAANARGVAFRDSSYLRLALLHLGQGRWSTAQADLARVEGPGGRLVRAYYASLPFVNNRPGELEEIRAGVGAMESDRRAAAEQLQAGGIACGLTFDSGCWDFWP